MRVILRWSLITTLLTSGFAVAQPSLILKNRRIDTSASRPVGEIHGPLVSGHWHLLLQFNEPPTSDVVAELKNRGVAVLADVPENGLLVSVEGRVSLRGLGVRFAGPIEPADKVSPLVSDPATLTGYLMVEFYPDVDINAARSLVLNLGIELHDSPDLGPQQLMIHASPKDAANLAPLDDVSYIFPASAELVNGTPVRPCAGAITTNGTTSQLIPTYGPGWDGPGLGAATVSYVFSKITSQLPTGAAEAEIQRAMAEWSKVVQVTWKQGTDPNGPRTVNILFATYAHGDGYPFDGPGGVLAHTFYPAPPNPEPIAGDMHFDDSESWHIGANTDLFSVALHELGHALGLGHSSDPNAVMYPYYRKVTTLSDVDKNTALTLYAAQTSTVSGPPATVPTPPSTPGATPPSTTPTGGPTPPTGPGPTPPNGGGNPPSAPLTLNVNVPPATTAAASINLSGAASGGTGAIAIAWSTDRGASGTAQGSSSSWTIAGVPLVSGANTITVTATAGASRVTQSVSVTRQSAPSVPSTDTTPPSLTIVSPGSTMVSTSVASITVSGTASDNVGVASVTWTTNTGSSGAATGTTSWSASVPLLVGSNTVTIRAADAAGNTSWRTVVAVRY